jgi:hypothetical protein
MLFTTSSTHINHFATNLDIYLNTLYSHLLLSKQPLLFAAWTHRAFLSFPAVSAPIPPAPYPTIHGHLLAASLVDRSGHSACPRYAQLDLNRLIELAIEGPQYSDPLGIVLLLWLCVWGGGHCHAELYIHFLQVHSSVSQLPNRIEYDPYSYLTRFSRIEY